MSENAFIAAAQSGKNGFWRYLGTILLVIVLTLGPASCLVSMLFILYRTSDFISVIPGYVILAINLVPFVFVPLGLWLGLRIIHHRPFLSIITPYGKINWQRLLLGGVGWAALAGLGDLVLGQIQPGNYYWSFNLNAFWPYLLICLLLIPIQASAEELLFRGYLTQGFGLIGYWAGWLIPSVLFGLLHGVNPEVGAYGWLLTLPTYIGMGLLLGWVTLRSKSLEIAIGMHIANNLYSSLIVTFPSSALQTEAIFTIRQFDAQAALIVFFISSFIFVLVFEVFQRGFLKPAVTTGVFLSLVLTLSACNYSPSALPDLFPKPPSDKEKTDQTLDSLPLQEFDCKLSGSQIDALCITLQIPENRALPDGRKISIYGAVVKAISRNPEPDPIFLLAGGPGQSAVETFSPLIGGFERIRQKHDIVMIDQRGTGKSEPLKCGSPSEDEVSQPIPELIEAEPPIDEQLEEVDACLQNFGEVDLTQYTTDIAMQDLDDVREALGYETINLVGISYGTRAALAYLSLYPDRVRSMVLDGVAPLGWGLGSTMRSDAQRALDMIFQRCERDDQCKAQYPDLKRDLADLLSSAREPVEVVVSDPATAEPRRVKVSPLLISSVVRLMSYSDQQAALIPMMIHQAAQGDYTLFASQYMLVVGSVGESMNTGMYFSVWCYEDLPRIPRGGELGAFYFDPNLDFSRAICQRWPEMNRSVDLPVPSNTTVPVLLISGEADPVTPPANGDLVAQQFSNSLHLVLPDMGHSNVFIGCMPNIVHDFISTASVENLSTDCLRDIVPLPFFLNPTGPYLRE